MFDISPAILTQGMSELEYWFIRKRGRLPGKYAHFCIDWDDLTIDEDCPEWPCICAAELGFEQRAHQCGPDCGCMDWGGPIPQ